jgi:2-keto-3-deoxy-6-phosphogluconate aldolase
MTPSNASSPRAAATSGSGLPFTDRVIPVVTIDHPQQAAPLGHALAEGGAGVVEVTFRTPAAAASLKILAGSTSLTVGAGTVLDRAQVDQARREIAASLEELMGRFKLAV